jgi:PKD domain
MRAIARTCLILAALVGLPAGALANDEVRVEPERFAASTVALSGLGEPDVQAREYAVDDGTGERRVTITGWSLDLLLRKAGPDADPYRFAGVEVSVAGAAVSLGREEVIRSDTFPDGPPVFWMEGGEVRFLRPAGAAARSVLLAGPGPAVVRLTRASELQVRAEASDRSVEPGDPVTFTATVDGAPDGEQVDVTWYFDDDRRGRGTRVTHRFRRPGTYDVSVGARTSPDDPGADDFVTVRVGKPPGGPNRKGGGTNMDANAPDSGVGTGSRGAGGQGSGSVGTGGSPAGGDAGAEDDAAGRDEAAARRRARRTGAAARGRAERRKAAERDRAPGRLSGPRQVRGIELADLSGLSSAAGRDALRAARRGDLRAEDGSGTSIPPAVWWTLGTAALLGLGGWREARSRPAGRAA